MDRKANPPHRTFERESAILKGRHPATVELLEYYEDSPSGREHRWPEVPPTRPGLGFDTSEDRDRVRELLLRIEDIQGKLSALRMVVGDTLAKARRDAGLGVLDPTVRISRSLLRELLDTFDTIKSER